MKFRVSDDELRRLYEEENVPVKELAARFGYSRKYIHKKIRRAGGAPVRTSSKTMNSKLRDIPPEEIRHLYEDLRMYPKEISEQYNSSESWVLSQVKRAGGKARPQRQSRWAKGYFVTKDGYKQIQVTADWPYFEEMGIKLASGKAKVLEHRKTMAEHLGRPLTSKETVHHINGDRLDNRLENLQLHHSIHSPGVNVRCKDCGSQNFEYMPL